MTRRACIVAVLVIVAAGCGTEREAVSPRRMPAVVHAASAAPSTATPPAGLPVDRIIGHPVTADVNGDGRPDRAVLRVWGHKWGGLRDALVVSLARGRQLRLGIPDDGTARYPADRLLGRVDVNGDGRSELVVFGGGNTELAASIAKLVGRRLVWATSPDFVPYFAAHGNACGACTQDATCQFVDGHPRLVETFSIYLSKRGRDLTLFEMADTHDRSPLASHRRRWEATIYDLQGSRLVKLNTLAEVLPAGTPLPSEFRFDGALNCGTAHWDLNSN